MWRRFSAYFFAFLLLIYSAATAQSVSANDLLDGTMAAFVREVTEGSARYSVCEEVAPVDASRDALREILRSDVSSAARVVARREIWVAESRSEVGSHLVAVVLSYSSPDIRRRLMPDERIGPARFSEGKVLKIYAVIPHGADALVVYSESVFDGAVQQFIANYAPVPG